MRNLERISIHDDVAFAGPIPPELAGLRALKWLRLSNNQLSGEQQRQYTIFPKGTAFYDGPLRI